MAKRKRASPGRPAPERLVAPTTDYRSADGEQVLMLRGAMTAKTRAQYVRESDPAHARAAATAEDLRARALEFLFERLVCRWEVSGVVTDTPKRLLARYRAASRDERAWITAVLREHCAEWFPDVRVP